ncbi:MAG: AAA family ATPase [Desulfovibrionaceae bacterium]|nr:AAA family ATPase [Desulfovibrionaceae bacterium]MBF0514533.1 AAA family ATPase [Desulfovibrionaceae bacterium]
MNHNEKAPGAWQGVRGQKAKEAAGQPIASHVDTVNAPGEKAGTGLDAASDPGVARKLVAVDVATFLAMDLPERGYILSPVIPTQGLVMLYAPRGMGKTFAALSIAYAIASGQTVMRWTVPSAKRVLYLDGEMSASAMRERLASIVAGTDLEPPDPSYLTIITPDLQPEFMPNLATSEGQTALEGFLEGVDLVVVDNLATLARHGRENEAESWLPVQGWILDLRRRGLSVLMIHHAGKGGNQRGTSSREDVLDTVIALKRPDDYQAEEGARFEVHLEKARGICGPEAKPFEAKLIEASGGLAWTTTDIEDVESHRVLKLKAEGLSVRDIAEETGIKKSKVHRLLKKAEAA